MGYTKVTYSHNGADSLAYLEGRGHNGHEKRNIHCTGVNMLSSEVVPYSAQMRKHWKRADKRMKIELIRVTQSFSKEELDPSKAEDILKAHEIGLATGKQLAGKDRQFVCATQIDGKSGLIHSHIMINNVDTVKHKCIAERMTHEHVKQVSDREIERANVTLDYGEKHDTSYTQTERNRKQNNKYVWKDDLRDRIRSAMEDSTNFKEFEQALGFCGVSLRKGKHLTYTLDDVSEYIKSEGKQPKRKLSGRAKSLGEEFDEGYVKKVFAQNIQGLQQTKQGIDKNIVPMLINEPITDDSSPELEFTKDTLELELVQAPQEEIEAPSYKFTNEKEKEDMQKYKRFKDDSLETKESLEKEKQREEVHQRRLRELSKLSVLQNMRMHEKDDWQFGD